MQNALRTSLETEGGKSGKGEGSMFRDEKDLTGVPTDTLETLSDFHHRTLLWGANAYEGQEPEKTNSVPLRCHL